MRTTIYNMIESRLLNVGERSAKGFSLIEMIVVIAIMGILGAATLMFIQRPVEEYIASARRADMNDIANTAMSRITRDLRTALPNSVRISGNYLEFIPTTGGGRYRYASDVAATSFPCPLSSSAASAVLDIGVADDCFEVLGPMPSFAASDKVVVNNTAANSAYNAANTATWSSTSTTAVTITSFTFPLPSPGNRFQVISTPVSYVCDTTAGTLTRYWGYAIQAGQPTDTTVAPLSTASFAKLATNVSTCTFSQPNPSNANLVDMQLTITESGESISLYNEMHVANTP